MPIDWSNPSVLRTAGAGFIESILLEELVNRGADVHVANHLIGEKIDITNQLEADIEPIHSALTIAGCADTLNSNQDENAGGDCPVC
ncbi:hypothetical protein [Natronomonas sp. EA1]|uniref:hypothetical protein n=1 Tax=Natronomonas sp. EA1 TaxID=3421655 RepID=UPI003EBC40B6